MRRHFSQRVPQTGDGFHTVTHRAQICMPKRSFPSRDDGHGPPFRMSNPFAMLITSAARFPPATTRVRLACSHALTSARYVFGVVYRVPSENVFSAFRKPARVFSRANMDGDETVFRRFVPKQTRSANAATALHLHFFTSSVLNSSIYLSMYLDDTFYWFLFSVRFLSTKQNISKHNFITNLIERLVYLERFPDVERSHGPP